MRRIVLISVVAGIVLGLSLPSTVLAIISGIVLLAVVVSAIQIKGSEGIVMLLVIPASAIFIACAWLINAFTHPDLARFLLHLQGR